jgi:protein SHQ1
VDGQEFKFHLAPYFLRLNLPGRVVEDDRATSSYDIATGTIICKVAKETLGEHFEDLDMLTKLLARRGEEGGPPKVKPLIEVLDEDEGEDDESVKDAPAEKDPLADKEKYGAFAQGR